MSSFVSRLALVASIAVFGVSTSVVAQATNPGALVSERIKKLTRARAMEAGGGDSRELQYLPSAGNGEDRRHAVRFVRRHQDADQALSAAAGRLRPRHGRGRRALVQARPEGQPDHGSDARRRHDVPPGRHRLRRQVDLGAGRRISSEQPRDHLPRRSSGDEGDRSLSLRRPRRRRGPQHREQVAAWRELGLAALLSLDARQRAAPSPTPRRRRSNCALPILRVTSTTRTASILAGRRRCAPASTTTR